MPTIDPDALYDECTAAIERDDVAAILDCADRIREWCNSDDAKDYGRSAVEQYRSYANLLNLNYGHRLPLSAQ